MRLALVEAHGHQSLPTGQLSQLANESALNVVFIRASTVQDLFQQVSWRCDVAWQSVEFVQGF